MFRAAVVGAEVTRRTIESIYPNLESLPDWPTNMAIRSDRLAWLCLNPAASAMVAHRGVAIRGFRFDGALDLDHAGIDFPSA